MTNANLNLKTKTRTAVGKAVAALRKSGKIPAVLYGHGVDPVNLEVDYSQFEKVYRQAGDSTLVDLAVDEKSPVKVLVQDYQLDPTTSRYTHVDFYQVRMDEKLHTDIVLKFVGEAPAIKEHSGILVTALSEVEVECLPADLVHEIEVDLSVLKEIDVPIHISDIKAPAGIKILNHPTDVVALVQPQRVEEEKPAVVEETAAPAQTTEPAEEK
ncbi:MAG: 50S ribosomal protein L25 [Candidatus Buchananbacteria bacterium]|nr:50S ribosomal protein L25 [Candidatus Buchananbacteria bacterium]